MPLRQRASNRLRRIHSVLPMPGISRPVFLIGCGRSGKSSLANRLANDREITYLNEPRHLWFAAFPQTDIWTVHASQRAGKVALDETDFASSPARKLARLFRFEALRNRGPTVIEELAINNFRLRFLRAVFPDARFIHIYRNGLEVAELIAEKAQTSGWFGAGDYKWNKLVEYAKQTEATRHLPVLCNTYRDRGLLEWRLGTEAVVSFLRTVPTTAYLEINSNQLIRDPASVLAQVYRFLDITPESSTLVNSANQAAPRAQSHHDLSAHDRTIGGSLLPLSISTDHSLSLHCDDILSDGAR